MEEEKGPECVGRSAILVKTARKMLTEKAVFENEPEIIVEGSERRALQVEGTARHQEMLLSSSKEAGVANVRNRVEEVKSEGKLVVRGDTMGAACLETSEREVTGASVEQKSDIISINFEKNHSSLQEKETVL